MYSQIIFYREETIKLIRDCLGLELDSCCAIIVQRQQWENSANYCNYAGCRRERVLSVKNWAISFFHRSHKWPCFSIVRFHSLQFTLNSRARSGVDQGGYTLCVISLARVQLGITFENRIRH